MKSLESVVRLRERKSFLKRCMDQNILLPSNFKKGIDRDLLITQQQRNIKVSLKEIANQIKQKDTCIVESSCKVNSLVMSQRFKVKWKGFYSHKFERLSTIQRKEVYQLNVKKKQAKKNKNDHIRYKKRKKLKEQEQINNEILRAHTMVLNKSDIDLGDQHRLLLMKGLNFVPTPKWNDSVEDNEWFFLMRHIRSCEWSSFFNNEDNEVHQEKLPEKLKIQKFNRPKIEDVDERTQTYCEMIKTKLRYLKPEVNRNYYTKNNLDETLNGALKELKSLVNDKTIIICRSDKDGKIVVINYNDYNKIMDRELKKFNEIKDLNTNNIEKRLESIRKNCENMIIKLYEEKLIDDNELRHIIGMKCDFIDNEWVYSRIPGPIAKHFVCKQLAYAYPLFKTHKLASNMLTTTSVFDIPTRLLQSAGNITTTRITAFIESILNPISTKFCKHKINEYCRDSKSYLEDLHNWKTTVDEGTTDELFLVAGDVQSLYPSIPRKHVKNGLKHALNTCSNYNKKVKKTIVELTMYCLENVIVQNDSKFYNQSQGIITGDNDSVSLANITLHYILLPIADILNQTVLFRRFIDDIIWISKSRQLTDIIQDTLTQIFAYNGLKLLFRRISTREDGDSLEFLDVNHIVCKNTRGGFYTKNYVKPTSVDRLFLNGMSHHPRSVFKSVVFSESTRMRRLNEREEDYREALEKLKEKCLRSGFNKNLVNDMIDLTKQWKERFSPPPSPESSITKSESRLVWTTQFPKLLKLNSKEKNLNQKAMVSYKRPLTLAGHLTNYRKVAHSSTMTHIKGSRPCNHCALCGMYGGKAMVCTTESIKSSTGKIFKINDHLTCKDFGIYVATCRLCTSQYVGHTVNNFSKRWNQHRSIWKNGCSESDDRAALRIHYAKFHPKAGSIDMADAFEVTFVDKPSNPKHLDILESSWISRLCANININKTPLPKYR